MIGARRSSLGVALWLLIGLGAFVVPRAVGQTPGDIQDPQDPDACGNAYWLYDRARGSLYFWQYAREPGSLYYWRYGQGPGSRYFWERGRAPGSAYFWHYGEGAGSASFWRFGKDAGSAYVWRYGEGETSRYAWEQGSSTSWTATPVGVAICLGAELPIAPCRCLRAASD